jgi:hypothetical protein
MMGDELSVLAKYILEYSNRIVYISIAWKQR